MVLADQECKPLQRGTPPLPPEAAEALAKETPQWTLKHDAIEREFRFGDSREAMGFVNRVAEVAEEQDHHPDIHISYAVVRLDLTTHAIGGLSQNDFIMAAKVDRLA